MPIKYCIALDLKNEEALIQQYEEHHRKVWPAVLESMEALGIISMEIFGVGNRLFMIMHTDDSFSFKAKAKADAENETVQQWEKLMWNYQQALPFAAPGEKWMLMNKIFDFVKR